jgi:hypothetical protein
MWEMEQRVMKIRIVRVRTVEKKLIRTIIIVLTREENVQNLEHLDMILQRYMIPGQ